MWTVRFQCGSIQNVDTQKLLDLFPTIDLTYLEDFIPEQQRAQLLEDLLPEVSGFLTTGDTRRKYAVSDFQTSPSWTPGTPFESLKPQTSSALLTIMDSILKSVNWKPNYALVNVYRDGNDTITWHADDIEGVVPSSSIASVSLGAEREFCFRPYLPGNRGRTEAWPVVSTPLKSGSLLIMGPKTNDFWCHSLPQDTSELPRINITFRCLSVYSPEDLPKVPEDGPGTANYARLEQMHKQLEVHPVFGHPPFIDFQTETLKNSSKQTAS